MNTIVQFLHPGAEHMPGGNEPGRMEWNRGEHRRKFLQASGLWTGDPKHTPSEGPFTVWNEWEPPSTYTAILQANGGQDFPQWLHLPDLHNADFLDQPLGHCGDNGLQNTDPLVFGDQFRYAICQQFTRNENATRLRWLNPGDIVLFGSHRGGSFLLDTVFVVERFANVGITREFPEWESALHKKIAMDLIEIPRCGVRLYGGRSWFDSRSFSFVPCRQFDFNGDPVPFRRPTIILDGVINQNQTQGFAATDVAQGRAREIWNTVVQQVLDQGCKLATKINEPNWQQE